jgi:hypothetical protein
MAGLKKTMHLKSEAEVSFLSFPSQSSKSLLFGGSSSKIYPCSSIGMVHVVKELREH